jgi:CRISPR-associated protein Csm1
VKLGENLAKAEVLAFVSDDPEIEIFDGYGIAFSEGHPHAIEIFDIAKTKTDYYRHWTISSYVSRDGDGAIVDFEKLAQKALREVDDGKKGIAALAVLKADVDDMGRFIRETDVTDSYENFATFSAGLDRFFSIEVPALMAEEYPDTYTVFAGGDDLFLIGAWSQMLDLAREITDRFERFTRGKLTVSLGVILVKPNTPVKYLAETSEKALEASKAMESKAAMTLFGETTKLSEYRKEGKAFYAVLKKTDEEAMPLPTAFMYRLLELLNLRTRMLSDAGFVEGSMWKSKLNYAFRRNVFEKLGDDAKRTQAQALLKACNVMIENHPEVARMVLSEFIYKRRKAS